MKSSHNRLFILNQIDFYFIEIERMSVLRLRRAFQHMVEGVGGKCNHNACSVHNPLYYSLTQIIRVFVTFMQ